MTQTSSISSHVSPWLSRLVYPLGRYLVLPLYFGRIDVKGREHVPQTGPVIFAPTHRARWDALIVPYAVGRDVTGWDLRFMVSADEMTGLQGWLIRRLGGFPVDRHRPGTASLRHGIELLEAGQALVIFPEGKISRTGQVQSLQPGLTRLALHAEAKHPGLDIKIVPLGIHYSQLLPGWGCDVEVRIGAPLHVKDYCKAPLKACAEQLKDDLETALQRLQEADDVSPQNDRQDDRQVE